MILKVENSKIACFTGHRPDKLNGYNPKDNKELLWKLRSFVVQHIEEKNVKTFITGMALGIDTWSALIVLKLKEQYSDLKLIAAVPCQNHSDKWTKESRDQWQYIIDRCNEVVYVSNEPYTKWCMQKRNKWMVDKSDYVIAVWDESPGGTENCVKYAIKTEKEITYINPKKL